MIKDPDADTKILPSANSLILRLVICAFLFGAQGRELHMLYMEELPYYLDAAVYLAISFALILTVSDLRTKIDRIRLLGKQEK